MVKQLDKGHTASGWQSLKTVHLRMKEASTPPAGMSQLTACPPARQPPDDCGSHIWPQPQDRGWAQWPTEWKWKSLSRVWLFGIPMDYIVHGILQARILEWPVSSPGDLPDPGIEPGLLHCRQILYQLSYQGRPAHLHHAQICYSETGRMANNSLL